MNRRTRVVAVLLLAVVATVGCGKKPNPEPAKPAGLLQRTGNALGEVGKKTGDALDNVGR